MCYIVLKFPYLCVVNEAKKPNRLAAKRQEKKH